jgi:hypothetical protein
MVGCRKASEAGEEGELAIFGPKPDGRRVACRVLPQPRT